MIANAASIPPTRLAASGVSSPEIHLAKSPSRALARFGALSRPIAAWAVRCDGIAQRADAVNRNFDSVARAHVYQTWDLEQAELSREVVAFLVVALRLYDILLFGDASSAPTAWHGALRPGCEGVRRMTGARRRHSPPAFRWPQTNRQTHNQEPGHG